MHFCDSQQTVKMMESNLWLWFLNKHPGVGAEQKNSPDAVTPLLLVQGKTRDQYDASLTLKRSAGTGV